MRKFFIIMALVMLAVTIRAAGFKSNGICYYVTSDSTVKVLPNGSTSSGGGIGLSNGYEGDIVIPAKVTYSGVEYTVTAVGEEAFSFSPKLTSVSIPATVTDLGSEPFASCGKLTSITVDPDNPTYESVDGVLYNENITTVIACPGAMSGALTIPATVNTVAVSAFYGCSRLTSITLPASVTEIGENAFRSCTLLQSVNIPDGVTEIKDYLCYGCSSLVSTNIPDRVVKIGNSAYSNCKKLPTMTLPSSLKTIGDRAFELCSSFVEMIVPEGVTSIGDFAMMSCSKMKKLSLPASLDNLGIGAFRLCLALPKIDLAEGNKSFAVLNGMLFDADTTSFICCPAGYKGECVIPSTVTVIEDYAFYYCKNVTSIKLPKNLVAIRTAAFVNCSSLKSIIIPNSVVTIGVSAFVSCSNLSTIVCQASTPPAIAKEPFSSAIYQKVTLYMPASSEELYSTTDFWKNFLARGLIGDVNQDGHVNVVDIMVMVNYVLGNAVVEFEPWAGDVNYDEIVNVTDIMGVVRICLGM